MTEQPPDLSDYVPAVSVAVYHDGAFLLVKRGREPSKGLYAFPGGRVHAGESDADAVRRELAEETGLRLATVEPLQQLLLPGSPSGYYPPFRLLVFRGFAPAGTLRAGDDADEAGWFGIDEMPSLPIIASVLATAHAIIAAEFGHGHGASP